MVESTIVITVNLIKQGKLLDLEIPLDIFASELKEALFEEYLPELKADMHRCVLRAERPIALIRDNHTLRASGLRDGSIINIKM